MLPCVPPCDLVESGVASPLHRLPSSMLSPLSSSVAGWQPRLAVAAAAAAHESGGAPNLVLPVVHEPLCSFSGIQAF
ncbi:hypothetical protein ACLOJK_000359 [Asimina triloba]